VVARGFYNLAAGDAQYFRELADNYALSDNHHHPVMGGTGANFQAFAMRSRIGRRRVGEVAGEPDREPEPAPRRQQLGHAVRLFERLVYQML
jgi:hypothetical protein